MYLPTDDNELRQSYDVIYIRLSTSTHITVTPDIIKQYIHELKIGKLLLLLFIEIIHIMTAPTSHLMSSCAYQLKLVNSIRASLNVQVAERVVNAIFTSRMDYCNSLLAGFTVEDFTRLQKLQNAAERCVLMGQRDFTATDMLCELYWLPVCKRIHYKLLLLTYKTLNGSSPEYLMNQLQHYCPTRALRSVNQILLSVKKTRIEIGDSSFTVAASVVRNALPCQIKKAGTTNSLKSMIKTISLDYKLCHL